jgi:hypothetical protein
VIQVVRSARDVRDPRVVVASSMSCKSVTPSRQIEKCANSASESLRTSKKTLGMARGSRMNLSVSGMSLALSGRFGTARVEKAVLPRVWMSMMWTVWMRRVQSVRREILSC